MRAFLKLRAWALLAGRALRQGRPTTPQVSGVAHTVTIERSAREKGRKEREREREIDRKRKRGKEKKRGRKRERERERKAERRRK